MQNRASALDTAWLVFSKKDVNLGFFRTLIKQKVFDSTVPNFERPFTPSGSLTNVIHLVSEMELWCSCITFPNMPVNSVKPHPGDLIIYSVCSLVALYSWIFRFVLQSRYLPCFWILATTVPGWVYFMGFIWPGCRVNGRDYGKGEHVSTAP